jgi:pyrrolidone-carboxylate peptidase
VELFLTNPRISAISLHLRGQICLGEPHNFRDGDYVIKVLVTGLGPFMEVTDNPSARVACDMEQPCQILEVSYQAVDVFVNRLDHASFDYWLMLGVASARPKVSLELFARNIRKGKDVLGNENRGEIQAGGPLLLPSTLWTPEIAAELLVERPKEVAASMDAGTYLCNYLLYRGLERFPTKRVGFMHVVNPDQVGIDRQVEISRRALSLAGA